MIHGRDHENREQKIAGGRARNIEGVEGDDVEWLAAGRTHVTPPRYLFGARQDRLAHAIDDLPPEEPADGAEVAPTEKATERERTRHREERKLGRMAAGVGENPRDRREPEVTRDGLEAAARAADAAVGVRHD